MQYYQSYLIVYTRGHLLAFGDSFPPTEALSENDLIPLQRGTIAVCSRWKLTLLVQRELVPEKAKAFNIITQTYEKSKRDFFAPPFDP